MGQVGGLATSGRQVFGWDSTAARANPPDAAGCCGVGCQCDGVTVDHQVGFIAVLNGDDIARYRYRCYVLAGNIDELHHKTKVETCCHLIKAEVTTPQSNSAAQVFTLLLGCNRPKFRSMFAAT